MSSHVTTLTVINGRAAIIPQQGCAYMYKRAAGDPAALQVGATSGTPAPPDPSWPPVQFKGIWLYNNNAAPDATTVTYGANFAIQGGPLTVPPNSYVYIWCLPANGALTEVGRCAGQLPAEKPVVSKQGKP
jgi:hypothetical protein